MGRSVALALAREGFIQVRMLARGLRASCDIRTVHVLFRTQSPVSSMVSGYETPHCFPLLRYLAAYLVPHDEGEELTNCRVRDWWRRMMLKSLPHRPDGTGLIFTHSSPGRSGSDTSLTCAGAQPVKSTCGHRADSAQTER